MRTALGHGRFRPGAAGVNEPRFLYYWAPAVLFQQISAHGLAGKAGPRARLGVDPVSAWLVAGASGGDWDLWLVTYVDGDRLRTQAFGDQLVEIEITKPDVIGPDRHWYVGRRQT